MNASELKQKVISSGNEPYYFDRSSMKFFGDTMKNYGVRSAIVKGVPCWELYRKRPVKHGLQNSSYFRKDNSKRVFGEA